MDSKTVLDLADRAAWTFVQALGGSIAAGTTAASLGTFDWRAALVGAGTAAAVCVLKVLGVNLSLASLLQGGVTPAPVAPAAPAPAPVEPAPAQPAPAPVAPAPAVVPVAEAPVNG